MALSIATFLVPTVDAWFCPDGTSFATGDPANPGGTGAGTTSKTAKAAATDPCWGNLKLGCITNASIKPNAETKKVYCPQGDSLVLSHTFTPKQESSIGMTANEVDPIAIQMIFGTQDLSVGSTQANPMIQNPSKEGWLKFQLYNRGKGNYLIGDFYGRLSISGDFSLNPEEHAQPEFTFDIYPAAISTISFA